MAADVRTGQLQIYLLYLILSNFHGAIATQTAVLQIQQMLRLTYFKVMDKSKPSRGFDPTAWPDDFRSPSQVRNLQDSDSILLPSRVTGPAS
jgi:hypothetical protein